MRRRLLPGLLCLLLAFSLTLPTRGAADQTDPVLAKSYLDQVAAAELKASVNDAAIRAMNAVYGKKLLALTEAVGDHRLQLAQKDTGNRAAAGQTLLLKQGDQLTLLPGARIEAVDEEGNSRVLAHWNAETNGLWHWGGLGNPGDFSTLATIFERTFARGHGWVPVRPIDRRRALADATDRRALRCMLGSALSQSGVTVNAWGVVDLATTDILVCTTHVLHWGLTGVVTSLHPDANGETMAAMSVHAPWSPAIEEAGMWGDEIGGFHADIPASQTGPYAHESMIAPARPTPGPLEELRLPWGGTRQEHWHKDFIELPSGTRVPVVVTAQGRVHAEAPDPRAVDILFPGPASFVPGPGPHVWVDVTDQGGVLLEATTTGQLFGSSRLSARIVGESEDEWHYHTPSLLRRVDPTSRPPHWGAKRLITKIRERLTPRDGQGTAP